MATKLNLIIDQGATYTNSSIIAYDSSNAAINLSTYTVASKIRKYYTSTNSVSFTATGNSTGYIALSLTANVTANIVAGRYVYDVEITSNTGIVTRVKEGIVTVNPNATY
jgi:hypothetical protein